MIPGPVVSLEASTAVGSVAIVDEDRVLAERTIEMRGQIGERLLPAIIDCLIESRIERRTVRAIACGGGPGSFTSLRIAGSLAKGLAMGLDAPLYVAPSHLLMVAGASTAIAPGRYLLAIDALRDESYVALVEVGERTYELEGSIALVAKTDLARLAGDLGATLLEAEGHEPWAPHARGVAKLHAVLMRAGPVDVDGWEPAYGRLAEAQVRWESVHGRAMR